MNFCQVQLFATPWSVACQASLSMGFTRLEYWSGLPLPFPGDLPNPGIEPESPALAGKFFSTEPPGKSMHLLSVAAAGGMLVSPKSSTEISTSQGDGVGT